MSGQPALDKYLLSVHRVPGIVLGAWDTMVDNMHRNPCLPIAYLGVEDSGEN